MSWSPSPEQEQVIDSWGQGMAVLAGAGSGKTTTLVEKCMRLLALHPDQRFVAVSFTERSAGDLRSKLSLKLTELGDPAAMSRHWVMTIHGLCGSIIREYPKEAGFDGEEVILSEAESSLLWERALESLWYDPISTEIVENVEALLHRENRESLASLLGRMRDLISFGVLESLENNSDPESQALARVSKFILEKYQGLKRRQGALDFGDLEKGADRALEVDRVREAYHRRFDLVLVDEFQDTNPLQARILWRFARPDVSNLCVVGDPKQSIYRFRDADVSIFQEYCAKLPIRHSLTWNFRSRPGIIEFANHVCGKIVSDSEIPFEALIPKRLPTEADSVVRVDVNSPSDLGRWIATEVEKGVPLHEMALLVRKIRGNEKWLRALVSSGIPIAVGSGGLFWEDPRVRELVHFLRWWDLPGHTLSGSIFLRAPWMGISDQTLDQWQKEDSEWQTPFFNSDHPIAKALLPYRKQVVRPAELLMTLLVHEQVEEELAAPLLGLWHRLEELSSRGLDFHGTIQEISKAMEESRREREVPAPRSLGQLTVLTLHGAKGLEFPHVILLDFGEKPRGADSPLLYWDRTRGAYLGRRDENGQRDRKTPVEAEWRELEKKKNLAESKRLFYVALTRARERLILVCPEIGDPLEGYIRDRIPSEDYWRGWIECFGASSLQREKIPGLGVSFKLQPAALPTNRFWISPQLLKSPLSRARHSVTEWTLLSRCPRSYEWKYIRPRLIPSELQDEPQDELGGDLLEMTSAPSASLDVISQKDLGSRVHSCLERGDYAGLQTLEEELGSDRFLALPVMNWAKNSHWMIPSDSTKKREVYTELNFEVPLGDQVLVGTMDRLVIQRNFQTNEIEKISLIDFKVSRKSQSARSLLASYQTQMALYAWAITRLEPLVSLDQVEGVLVSISAQSVSQVAVEWGRAGRESIGERLGRQAMAIVRGEEGVARPGSQCKVCEFRTICDSSVLKKPEQLHFLFGQS